MTIGELDVYRPLGEVIPADWPVAALVPDALDDVWVGGFDLDATTQSVRCDVLVEQPVVFTLPGIDFLSLHVAPAGAGTALTFRAGIDPLRLGVERVPVVARVDSDVLRRVKPGTREVDTANPAVDITLGTVDVSLDADGNVALGLQAGVTLPRCLIGDTGIVVSATGVTWLTPASPKPAGSTPPPGFTGLYVAGATIEVPGVDLPAGTAVKLDHLFIGTGGVSGSGEVTAPLSWDGTAFNGPLAVDLFGFRGGLTRLKVTLRQNALTACEIAGDVYVGYLDAVVGLDLGLDGAGGLTAAVAKAHATLGAGATGTQPGTDGYLARIDAWGVLRLDVAGIAFSRPAGRPASIAFSGRIGVTVPGLDSPAVELTGLRIDSAGNVAVDGGWIDLTDVRVAAFHGFPIELSRVGFGADESGRRWVGLSGGIKLAEGLPLGAAVDGLRIFWHPTTKKVDVTLSGVDLAVEVPGAFTFAGSVSFFSDPSGAGFRGSVQLTLTSLGMTVDASIVVGRMPDGATFFYLYLGVDLPAGIPLFQTGAAFYGFAGLVAVNMAPDRRGDEHWYYGWYNREPRGATDGRKWAPQRGAFAVGAGVTLGTAPDNGFAFNAKALLILVLPGPRIILNGKAKFLAPRPGTTDRSEGTLEALFVLDVPGRLFQANLAATYRVPALLDVRGGADVAFSWATSPPPDVWHVYVGEKTPMARRLHADLLTVLEANAYFMLTRQGIELGAWTGIDERFQFGPARAWLSASLEGAAKVTWDPQQFDGSLRLLGDAGIRAFGAGFHIVLDGHAQARGPKPWWVRIDVHLALSVDLWLFSWSIEIDLPLEWGNKSSPVAGPVTPHVTGLAIEHLKADEARALPAAGPVTVPPDARPVVLFNRPVADKPAIGAPGDPQLPAEKVGDVSFRYELRHVALYRTDGGKRLVGAAGLADVSGATVKMADLAHLPDAAGAEITFPADKTAYRVASGSAGSLTLAAAAPNGSRAYRLSGKRASEGVTVAGTPVTKPLGTADVTLAAAPAAGDGAYAGGVLKTSAGTWDVLANTGSTVVVRPSDPLPAAGTATLVAPAAPVMEGVWLPVEDQQPAGGTAHPTKLMLWTRTPFAYFRRNDRETTDAFQDHNTDYACGPAPLEEPVCVHFEDLARGPLTGAFQTDAMDGDASGEVEVAPAAVAPRNVLRIGFDGDRPTQGTVVLRFAPEVDAVWLTGYQVEAGTVVARRGGADVGPPHRFGRHPEKVSFDGGVDELEISGSGVVVESVCFLPGWTCQGFLAASFPQQSTGRVPYGGLVLETSGRMTVDAAGVLTVTAPPAKTKPQRVPALPDELLLRPKVLEGVQVEILREKVGPLPLPQPEPVPGPRVLAVSDLDAPVVTKVAGLGELTLVPAAVRGGREVELRSGPLRPKRVIDLKALAGLAKPGIPYLKGTGRKTALASLTIHLPQPVTRVRVRLAAAAEVVAFAGAVEVARGKGTAGQDVALLADPGRSPYVGWIDRVTILAPSTLKVSRVCWDGGAFGWARFEQWQWVASVRSAVDKLYQREPVLLPGTYELHVVTAAVTVGGGAAVEDRVGVFTVGPPPGLGTPTGVAAGDRHYPHGGPLADLGTYVAGTLPDLGARPVYRAYDTGVRFTETYVDRMYVSAGAPLSLVVVDSNQRPVRTARNVWGDVTGELDGLVKTWVETLHGDGTKRCADVRVDLVDRPDAVLAGGGELLAPAELHVSELRAGSAVVHRVPFVTSRYAGFAHHVASFDGRCRAAVAKTGGLSGATATAGYRAALDALAAATKAYADALKTATTGSPSKSQLREPELRMAALGTARGAARAAARTAFATIWQQCFGASPEPAVLPHGVEVTRVASAGTGDAVLLVESGEPLPWERVTLAGVGAQNRFAVRRTGTSLADRGFGAPDDNTTVRYAGRDWTTTKELTVAGDALRTKVAGAPVTITLTGRDVTRLAATVRVAPGGSVDVRVGTGGAVTQGPSATAVVVAASGGPAATATISGKGFELLDVTLDERWVPPATTSDVRIAGIGLPQSGTDTAHWVALTAFRDTDLTGWTVRWTDTADPARTGRYAAVPAGTILRDGRQLRLYPAVTTPPAVPGTPTYGSVPGVTTTSPDQKGAVYELLDPAGRVVHEVPALATSPLTGYVAVPNADGTRAFLVPTTSPLDPGHWTVGLRMARGGFPDLPQWSVAGDGTTPEEAVLRFTTE